MFVKFETNLEMYMKAIRYLMQVYIYFMIMINVFKQSIIHNINKLLK